MSNELSKQIERLVTLSEMATPGIFEYRIGDYSNNHLQVPCVIGGGLDVTGDCSNRSCVVRFADDYEGHADAQLFAALVNWFRANHASLRALEPSPEREEKTIRP